MLIMYLSFSSDPEGKQVALEGIFWVLSLIFCVLFYSGFFHKMIPCVYCVKSNLLSLQATFSWTADY